MDVAAPTPAPIYIVAHGDLLRKAETRAFVDSIRAPAKAFILIEGAGHFAVFIKSSAFLDELVSRVLPLAR